MLELWLTYIQPWRYTDPLRPSTENKESLESLPRRWRGYVLDNFPFYSSLLIEIIGRSFQMDLTSDPGTTLLFRVSRVFAQPGLMSFIQYGESLLVNSDLSHSNPRNSPAVDACSLKALFMELDGPLYSHQPLLHDDDTLTAVQLLVEKVQESLAVLSARLMSPDKKPPPPSWPSATRSTNHPPPPPPPPLTPLSPNPPSGKQSKSWWKGLFGDDSGHYSPPLSSYSSSSSSHVNSDLGKLISHLENTEKCLQTIFGLSSLPQFAPGDSSPQWTGRPSPLGSPYTPLRLASVSSSHIATLSDSPKSLQPDYIRGTAQLTPRGKAQLIRGYRKSSNLNVPYLGDPLLQPIRSYESTRLVRILHNFSLFLNDRFARQLKWVGVSNSFLSRVAKQFLSPPLSPPFVCPSPSSSSSNDVPQTPKSRVSRVTIPPPPALPTSPRFNLRPLASYYSITGIALGLGLLWLILLPLWLLLLLLLLFSLGSVLFAGHCTKHNTKTL